jgi:hypothetical protein
LRNEDAAEMPCFGWVPRDWREENTPFGLANFVRAMSPF